MGNTLDQLRYKDELAGLGFKKRNDYIGKGGFMSILKESFKEKDGLKVRVARDRYGDEMVTSVSSGQWTGFPVRKEMAELIIESLKEFYDIK